MAGFGGSVSFQQMVDSSPTLISSYEVAITDIQRASALINEMAETIQKIGMSPLKF